MSIAFGIDGSRMSRGNITHMMAESKKSKVRILFATKDIIAGRIRFPPTNADSASLEGYFSTNLESVRKDVECTFGILKKRWRVLNDGFYYHDINTCEKIFVTCCCLNNFLVDLMERTNVGVGRGVPIGDDGIWLDGHTTNYSTDTSTWHCQNNLRRGVHCWLNIFTSSVRRVQCNTCFLFPREWERTQSKGSRGVLISSLV
jgi:hypothetical protein